MTEQTGHSQTLRCWRGERKNRRELKARMKSRDQSVEAGVTKQTGHLQLLMLERIEERPKGDQGTSRGMEMHEEDLKGVNKGKGRKGQEMEVEGGGKGHEG